MTFVFLLAVMLTMVISESSPHSPTEPAALHFAIAVCSQAACLLAILSIGRTTRAKLCNPHISSDSLPAILRRHHGLNQAVWLLGIAAALLWGKWAQLVRYNLDLANAVLVDELLILIPVVLPALMLWGTNYDLELALLARENRYAQASSRRFHFIWTHAQFYLGLIVLPLLLVIGGHDALQRWGSDWLRKTLGSFAWFPMLAGVLLALPFLIRRFWRTKPLAESPLRSQLLADCHELGMQIREILIWHTHGYAVNAAVLGLTPWNRYVLLTDGLVARLDDTEISAVFRHEVAHIRRRHLPIRLLFVALPLLGLFALQSWAPLGNDGSLTGWNTQDAAASPWWFTASLFAYLTLSLGWISRLQEYDADLWAARLYFADRQAGAIGAGDLARALDKLAGQDDDSRRRAGWLHPSLQSRIDLLHRAAADPIEAARFQRSLQRASFLILAAYAGLGLFWFTS